MAIAGEFLCKMARHLCQRLVGRDADADGHTHPLLDFAVQPLAPFFEFGEAVAVEAHEALVYGISETVGRLAANDVYDACREFLIKFVVGREYGNLFPRKLLRELIIGRAGLDAEGLCLVGARHNAAVVIRQHHDGYAFQIRSEHALATHVTVVAVNNAVHTELILIITRKSPAQRADGRCNRPDRTCRDRCGKARGCRSCRF